MVDSIPASWGNWRPCKKCNVVQPPHALSEGGTCTDEGWCLAHIAAPPTISVTPKPVVTEAPKKKTKKTKKK